MYPNEDTDKLLHLIRCLNGTFIQISCIALFIIILFLLHLNIYIPIKIQKTIYKGILAKRAAQKVSAKGTKCNNLKQTDTKRSNNPPVKPKQ